MPFQKLNNLRLYHSGIFRCSPLQDLKCAHDFLWSIVGHKFRALNFDHGHCHHSDGSEGRSGPLFQDAGMAKYVPLSMVRFPSLFNRPFPSLSACIFPLSFRSHSWLSIPSFLNLDVKDGRSNALQAFGRAAQRH